MATVELEQQRLLIGGEWVPASSGRSWESSGPVDGVRASSVAAAGRKDARRAADAAADAFPSWSNSPPAERRALLARAADVLEERSQEIAAIVTEETGGTFGWGMFNCSLAAGMLREAAAQAYGLIGEVIPSDGGAADGLMYAPTVLAGVTPEMRVYAEESFGPVVSIVPVDGVDEAVRVANDTEYGLSASVFGQDVPRAFDVARRIESGMCHVNGTTVHDEAQMPFGGVKASGFGRFGGRAALEEFTELRWITVGGPQGRHYPI